MIAESAVRMFLITLVMGLLLMAMVMAWLDGLGASWDLGGPGTRHASDVEISREWVGMTGTIAVPLRMDAR